MKTQGQTDGRILGLSYKDFEDEFGFRPDDKIEQLYFATRRERLTDPRSRKTLEEMDKIKKAAAKRRQVS